MYRTAALLSFALKGASLLAIEEAEVRAIPKAELHIHLTGSYPLDYLRSIATDEQFAALEKQVQHVQAGAPYQDFFRAFASLSAIVNTDEKVEDGVVALADWLISHGVVYCELRTGLKDLGNGLEKHLQSVLRGMERGSAGRPFTWRLLLSVRRDSSPQLVDETINLMLKYTNKRQVIGMDLSGDIRSGDPKIICAAIDRVHAAGLPVTVHMGEVPEESDQVQVLESLKPQRIGHGVFLSDEALDYLRDHQIPLEVCLRSAEAASMVDHHSEHPGHRHSINGHPISLSTDDPLFFATSPTLEQTLYAAVNKLSLEQLKEFNRASFDQLFVKTHRMHCEDPWFSLLRSGTKTVEGRIRNAKWANIVPGDLIEFQYDGDYFYADVIAIRSYPSVHAYLDGEGLSTALPGVSTIEDGLQIYHQWNTAESIAQVGFLAIEIKALTK